MSQKQNSIKYGKMFAIILCLIIGALANQSTSLQKVLLGRTVIGGPMVALLVTMVFCNLLPTVSKEFKEGTTYCSKTILKLGYYCNWWNTKHLRQILGTGVKALPLIVINVILSFRCCTLIG